MSFLNEFSFNLNNFIIFLFYIILSLKLVSAGEFIDLKKLNTYNAYFVVLDTGLYLYDINFFDCAIIISFNDTIYRSTNNKINLTEMKNDEYSYIFCMINEYLFIFNESNNKTISYKVGDIDVSKNYYYNLMPYKYENDNISFFISYFEETIFYFLYYNFSIEGDIMNPEKIIIENININNKMVRCEIISYLSLIKCFYNEKINNINYFSSFDFSIDEMQIKNKFNMTVNNIISQIKFAISYNNNFFICILISSVPFCYINEYITNNLEEINCTLSSGYVDSYKVLYFNETDEFIFISRYQLTTTLVDNYDYSVTICDKNGIFTTQNNPNTIIFNTGYEVINYNKFRNYNKCYNILKDDKNLFSSIPIETTYIPEMIHSTNMPTTNIPTTNINVPTTNINVPTTNINVPTTNINIPTTNINVPTIYVNVPTTNNFPFINNSTDYYIYENYTYNTIPIQNISSIPFTESVSRKIFSTTLDDTIIEKGINPLTTQLLEELKTSIITQENVTITTLKNVETDINTTSLITSIIHPNSQNDYSDNTQTNFEISLSIESIIQTDYQNQSYNKISEYISQTESNFITNIIISGNNEEVIKE